MKKINFKKVATIVTLFLCVLFMFGINKNIKVNGDEKISFNGTISCGASFVELDFQTDSLPEYEGSISIAGIKYNGLNISDVCSDISSEENYQVCFTFSSAVTTIISNYNDYSHPTIEIEDNASINFGTYGTFYFNAAKIYFDFSTSSWTTTQPSNYSSPSETTFNGIELETSNDKYIVLCFDGTSTWTSDLGNISSNITLDSDIPFSSGLGAVVIDSSNKKIQISLNNDYNRLRINADTQVAGTTIPKIDIHYVDGSWSDIEFASYKSVNEHAVVVGDYTRSTIIFDIEDFKVGSASSSVTSANGFSFNGVSYSTSYLSFTDKDRVQFTHLSSNFVAGYNGYSHPTIKIEQGAYLENSVGNKTYFNETTLYFDLSSSTWSETMPSGYTVINETSFSGVDNNSSRREVILTFSDSYTWTDNLGTIGNKIKLDGSTTLETDGGSIAILKDNDNNILRQVKITLNNDYEKIEIENGATIAGLMVPSVTLHYFNNEWTNMKFYNISSLPTDSSVSGNNIDTVLIFDSDASFTSSSARETPSEISGFYINGIELGVDDVSLYNLNGIYISPLTTIFGPNYNGYSHSVIHIEQNAYIKNSSNDIFYFDELTIYRESTSGNNEWSYSTPEDFTLTKTANVKEVSLDTSINNSNTITIEFELNDLGTFDSSASNVIDSYIKFDETLYSNITGISISLNGDTITFTLPDNNYTKASFLDGLYLYGYKVSPFELNFRGRWFTSEYKIVNFNSIKWNNKEENHDKLYHNYDLDINKTPVAGSCILLSYDKLLVNTELTERDYLNRATSLYEVGSKIKINGTSIKDISGAIVDYFNLGNDLFIYVPIKDEYTLTIESGTIFMDSVLDELTLYYYNGAFSNKPLLTVAYNTNGGETIDNARVVQGETLTLVTSVTKESSATTNYTFLYWYLDDENTEFSDNSVINSNITLYAKYSESARIYRVTYYDENNDELEELSEDVAYGTTLTLKDVPTKTGYTGSWTGVKYDLMPAENISYKASYAVTTYTITINRADGSTDTIEFTDEDKDEKIDEIELTIDTAEYTYSWEEIIPKVLECKNYTFNENRSKVKYTITFINEGEEYEKSLFEYGATPECTKAEPAKGGNETTYWKFIGWSPKIETVTCDKTYTATYEETYHEYTIRFLDYNGDEISNTKYHYGATVAIPSNPTRDDDNTYTYSFKGWDKEVTLVDGAKDYTAEYNSTYINYTITFKGETGNVILEKTDYHYNDKVVEPATKPTKDETDTTTYVFKEWSPTLTVVMNDQVYTPIFNEINRTYNVRYYDENDDELTDLLTVVENGAEFTLKDTISKDGYTASWDGEMYETMPACDISYKLKYTPVNYTITILRTNRDSEQLSFNIENKDTILKDVKLTDDTKEYTYSWETELPDELELKDYTFTETRELNSYTITFKNGEEVLQTGVYEYGVTPKYDGKTPTKNADNVYSYEFKGWNPEIGSVEGDTEYIAEFNEEKILYTVKFLTFDDIVIKEEKYGYGDTVNLPTTPYKDSTKEKEYTFSGWNPEVGSVTGDATYRAVFTESDRRYYIYYFDEKNVEIESLRDTVTYGSEYKIKDAIGKMGYTGSWIIAGDLPLTGTMESDINCMIEYEVIEYNLRVERADGSIENITFTVESDSEELLGSIKLTENTDEYTYSWKDEFPSKLTLNTQTITEIRTKNKYTVTFMNGSTTILTKELEYGEMISYDGTTPEMEKTAEFTFEFDKWDKEFMSITGNVTYNALYTRTRNNYTVTFMNDKQVLYTREYAYGETPTYSESTPIKDRTQEFTYKFSGWNKEITKVVEDTIYYAEFTETKNKYKVTFMNDNILLLEKEIEYGIIPEYDGPAIKKDKTQEYSYEFKGWDKELVRVTDDVTYTATFTEIKNKYKVTFMNDNTVIYSTEVEYGTKIESYSSTTPTKDATAEYSYKFIGWDKEFGNIIEDTTYVSVFEAVKRSYVIKFNIEGVEKSIDDMTLEYGSVLDIGDLDLDVKKKVYVVKDGDTEITKLTVSKDTTLTITYSKKKGCKNEVSSMISVLITMLLVPVILRKKKKINNY